MINININSIPQISNSLVIKKQIGTGVFPAHGLLDTVERRLLAVSYYADTVIALQAQILNTRAIMKINQSPSIVPRDLDNLTPWRYVFDGKSYALDSALEYPADAVIRWMMINEKAAALDQIHTGIQMHRRTFQRDMLFQADIYRLKLEDARTFKAQPDIDADLVPFVRDYAQLLGTDLDHAANAIILQADIYKSRMVDSDALRIKYTHAVAQCTTAAALHPLVDNFQKECWLYGKI